MNEQKKRVFINHGFESKPLSGWFPWLKEELIKRGFEVHVPQMPNAEAPQLDEWLSTIEKYVGIPDEQTFFVGHSLGCLSIVHFLQKLPPHVRCGGCVFVAGFNSDLGEKELKNFADVPVNFDNVIPHTKKRVCIVSKDDGEVPLDIALSFQKSLDAELILEDHMGHFDDESNIIYLEAALQSLLKMAD